MRPLLSSSIRRVMRASVDFDAGGAAWAGRSSLPAPGYELAACADHHTQRVLRRRTSGTINTPRPARKSRPKPPNQTRRASSPGDVVGAAIVSPSGELAPSPEAAWPLGAGAGGTALLPVPVVLAASSPPLTIGATTGMDE